MKGKLACKICHTHYLLELLTSEKNILLRKYCFCGESTSEINNNIKKELMKDFNYNEDNKCKCIHKSELDIIDERKTISQYCNDCNEYLCKDCTNKHNHKNLIDPNLFLINCKLHPKQILVGYCRKCIKPLCKGCIDDFHKYHDIRYVKQLNNFIIEKYQDNLLKSFSKCKELIKIKYGHNMELTISDLSSSQNFSLMEFEDKQIIITLEILQAILDLYIYHNNNGSLNYQLISNILKHINFEIIRLPDKRNDSEDNSSKNNLNFNNNGNKYIDDTINKNIVLHLQIDLNDEEKRAKKINILSSKNLKLFENASKMMMLKNGDLVFSCYFELQILKNLKDISTIKSDGQINDFIQLQNENLAVLSTQGDCSRNWINILEIFDVKNNFKIIKEICLQPFERNKRYSKIITINDNFVLLSYSIIDQKININYINNKDYKEIKLLELDGKIGNIIYINGYIIITTSIPRQILKIYFYDFQNKNLEKCLSLNKAGDKLFDIFSLQSPLNNFVINDEKILISTELYGLIINVKTKEIESKIENFKNIYCIANLNGYLLAGFNNGIISQINMGSFKINNNFIINFDRENSYKEIVSIVDIGNNQFGVLLYNNGLYIFNYK